MDIRSPTHDEMRIIRFLAIKSGAVLSQGWEEKLLVASMSDGGMGSLKLFLGAETGVGRAFGRTISECNFIDSDGVLVIASLNVDKEGDLFELDMWKTNYERLIRIPESIQ